MKQVQNYEIHTIDGTVRFRGRKLSREVGWVPLPKRLRGRMTVTIYVTESGQGVIREDIKVNDLFATYVNMVQPGTSPEWSRAEELPEGTTILDAAWRKACAADPTLRPLREWQITEDFDDLRIQSPNGTYTRVRMKRYR